MAARTNARKAAAYAAARRDWPPNSASTAYTTIRALDNALWEMLESEPHPTDRDSEGDEDAHRPLWVVAPQDTDGHSPHVTIPEAPLAGTDADHVIGLEVGTKKFYSAQWHVHAVFEPPGVLASDVVEGAGLTSEAAIMAAENEELVSIVETPTVFTCPVRPHNHN